jgi:hypothetical protein
MYEHIRNLIQRIKFTVFWDPKEIKVYEKSKYN